MRALIAGATGFVGRRLTPALLEDGLEVRCLVRDGRSAAARELAARCELVEADLTDATPLADAFAGVDLAYFLVHLMGQVDDYPKAEIRAATRFATAAREAGVAQMVYLGGLGRTRPPTPLAAATPS